MGGIGILQEAGFQEEDDGFLHLRDPDVEHIKKIIQLVTKAL